MNGDFGSFLWLAVAQIWVVLLVNLLNWFVSFVVTLLFCSRCNKPCLKTLVVSG
jgi:hypothetical protein